MQRTADRDWKQLEETQISRTASHTRDQSHFQKFSCTSSSLSHTGVMTLTVLGWSNEASVYCRLHTMYTLRCGVTRGLHTAPEEALCPSRGSYPFFAAPREIVLPVAASSPVVNIEHKGTIVESRICDRDSGSSIGVASNNMRKDLRLEKVVRWRQKMKLRKRKWFSLWFPLSDGIPASSYRVAITVEVAIQHKENL